MNKRLYLPLAGVALAAAAVGYSLPGQAHHAFAAEFDSSRPLVIEGSVTKARFVNPHSWIYLDVRNRDGSITNWGFEFGTPSSLRSNGITRADVPFGTEIRIAGFHAKNGGPFGYAATVALPGGRQVRTGGAPDAPTPTLR